MVADRSMLARCSSRNTVSIDALKNNEPREQDSRPASATTSTRLHTSFTVSLSHARWVSLSSGRHAASPIDPTVDLNRSVRAGGLGHMSICICVPACVVARGCARGATGAGMSFSF
jgi:hypothetical protein